MRKRTKKKRALKMMERTELKLRPVLEMKKARKKREEMTVIGIKSRSYRDSRRSS